MRRSLRRRSTGLASAWDITMSETPYPKVLAFLEGMMERFFFNNNFQYVDVIPVSNGLSVSLESMCKSIETGYRAKNMNPDYVVVWVDHEGRSESAADMRAVI